MTLRRASTEVKQLDLGDGDWVGVVKDVSKRDFNKLIAAFPATGDKGITIAQGTDLQTTLFDVFVRTWSLEDVDPTVEEYLSLERESASKIDGVLMDHFSALTLTAPKGKGRRT